MARWHAIVVVLALLALLAVGAAGCAGVRKTTTTAIKGHPPGSGEVRLVVSRDFGATIMHDENVPRRGGLTVMAVLAERARVTTAYGGGFVSGIDGVGSTFGGVSVEKAADWFYWVDGIMAGVGARDYRLHGGETVWWDFHQWAKAMSLPATVSAFPAPWRGRALTATGDSDITALEKWAAKSGLRLGAKRDLGGSAPSDGIVVATAAEVQGIPWLRARIAGENGGVKLVEIRAGRMHLRALDGMLGPEASGACLALPSTDGAEHPLLLLLVEDSDDLQPLLDSVAPSTVTARLGIAVVDGAVTLLPWEAK